VLNKIFFILFLFFTVSYAADKQLDKVSVQLLWKHQFEFAGFYIAKEKGFYEEFGLDVDIKEFDFGVNITKDVASGKSTFGIQYPSIMLDKSKGANVTLLNALFQSSPHVFVTLKSSNINTIKDFKGKSIMMEGDTVKTASLLGMLYANKITNESFSKVKPSFNIED
jgi:polar amino acid transport system substrate-binding protein